jgi:membrane protease YdiL (CAAX protease family)
MFDHINFSIRPFAITHFNALQQLTCLLFGVFYAWHFLRFKNYYAIVLAHGLLNVFIWLSALLLFLMM